MADRIISVVIPVYRDGKRAVRAAKAISRQSLPDGTSHEVIVVDDGSDDDTVKQLSDISGKHVRILSLQGNQGRSAARNAGAAVAVGTAVVFMDCDCLPVGDDFLKAHLQSLAGNAVASTGHVDGEGAGFWHRYQQAASARRETQHDHGHLYAGSSQNMAVERVAFEAVGGFDTGYAHYGFEDRDLLLRLSALGRIAWAEGATVRHLDSLTLARVAAKMAEAGEWTSIRFSQRHPEAYRALGYARLDATLHTSLLWPAKLSAPVVPALARIGDVLLAHGALPFALGKLWVRLVSALAFLVGTSRRFRVTNPDQ